MGNIIVLDELTTCKIAAGEVIERPASVVKEMVENSIDAGASSVSVEIRSGGIKYIKVSDNGCGIAPDDAVIAFDKHATSKIHSADDLDSVTTLGFRGEALASIAAVSDVELISRCPGAGEGTCVHIAGGKVLETGSRGAPVGTTFVVRDLFYNTPARYKFLKKDSTEAGYVCDMLQKIAMAHPEVAVRLVSSGTELLRTPGNGDLKSTIYSIFGKGVAEAVKPVALTEQGISVSGFVGVGEASFGNRSRQIFFVNGRYVKSKTITAALDEGCNTLLMKGRFAFAVLSVEVSCFAVDVNVHPAKTEVRFSDESALFRCVAHAIAQTFTDGRAGNASAVESAMPAATEKVVPPAPASELPKRKSPLFTELHSETPSPTPKQDPWKMSVVREEPVPAEQVPIADVPAEPKPRMPVNPFYKEARVVGQVLQTYLVLEYEDSVYLLDQHAAHERLMYERLRYAAETGERPAVQLLFVPVTVELAPSEMLNYRETAGYFTALGFEIEEFGGSSIIVRAIPAVMLGTDIKAGLLEILGRRENGRAFYSDEALHMMACKAAVKGNQALRPEEIRQLMDDLAETVHTGTCPHGRPIVTELSKYEIEKRFKRT